MRGGRTKPVIGRAKVVRIVRRMGVIRRKIKIIRTERIITSSFMVERVVMDTQAGREMVMEGLKEDQEVVDLVVRSVVWW